MTLQELQKMIKEEFNYFVKEQGPMGGPMGGPGGPAGMPKPPMPPGASAPGIEVGDNDIDAMEAPAGGPEGAEAQLQKIFGMLNSYFEGGEEGMEPEGDDEAEVDLDVDAGPEAPEDIVEPAGDEEEETMEEAYGETKGGNATNSGGKYGGSYGATGTGPFPKGLHEGFKSRLQKLANIKK